MDVFPTWDFTYLVLFGFFSFFRLLLTPHIKSLLRFLPYKFSIEIVVTSMHTQPPLGVTVTTYASHAISFVCDCDRLCSHCQGLQFWGHSLFPLHFIIATSNHFFQNPQRNVQEKSGSLSKQFSKSNFQFLSDCILGVVRKNFKLDEPVIENLKWTGGKQSAHLCYGVPLHFCWKQRWC
jgi:hypothetical protein